MDGGSGAQIANSGRTCCPSSWVRSWGTFITSENAEDLIVLKELIEAGQGHAGDRQDVCVERRP